MDASMVVANDDVVVENKRFRVTSPDMTPKERRKIYRRRQYEKIKAADPVEFNRKSAEAWRRYYQSNPEFRAKHAERRNIWGKERRAKIRAEKLAAAAAKDNALVECEALKKVVDELNAQLLRLNAQTNDKNINKRKTPRKSKSKVQHEQNVEDKVP